MENNISVRIYIKNGKLEHIVPEFPWEGQINAQVVYHDIEFDKLDGDFCREFACPEGPAIHKHEGFATAVIRAESMQSDPIHTHEFDPCKARTEYRRLADGLSEMVEGFRLREEDIPDDYQWLVEILARIAGADPEKQEPGHAHTHEYETKPDGSRRMDANCGAYVCLDCGDHQGLARCYCGWASDGGNGVAQLRAEGENVEDDY